MLAGFVSDGMLTTKPERQNMPQRKRAVPRGGTYDIIFMFIRMVKDDTTDVKHWIAHLPGQAGGGKSTRACRR
eukprot:767303-Pyramimonas_sp.AAC.2